ncbi:hypothetical protein ES765_00865 [Maribacter sp. ACAM166]|nr:hypothetical protein ES765_00865 [Maribacter sp. ACAM166]
MGWLKEKEHLINITKAGEGNMNVVLRVTTNLRSIIVKQSRPFVQKHQDIPAPLNRIVVENTFYSAIQSGAIKKHFPAIIGFDTESYSLVMEDLGGCDDMNFIYEQRSISNQNLDTLIAVSHHIHSTVPPTNFPLNLEMRELNHQHIFVLPFKKDNGFSLDTIQPGLQKLSIPFKEDLDLREQVTLIGEKYLSKGNTLLHGDYYPGSWMAKDDHLYIIDPEFGFVGFAEFDMGVMAAHLIMATHDISYLRKIKNSYPSLLDTQLLKKIAGIEIMRRLIGLAQLPLSRTLEEKRELLMISKNMILS